MQRLMTIAVALSLLTMTTGVSAQVQYGWTISADTADPFANSGAATFGVATKYLWFNCGDGDGMSAAEFELIANGPTVLAFSAMNGYLNAGAATHVLLAVGGCPIGPVVAGSILIIDSAGDISLAPAVSSNTEGTVDCQPAPSLWPIEWVGYGSNGTVPRSGGDASCSPIVSVEGRSWGEVKGLYR